MPTSSSACFSACIASRNLKASGWVWRRRRASFAATADAFGPRPRPGAGQPSSSLWTMTSPRLPPCPRITLWLQEKSHDRNGSGAVVSGRQGERCGATVRALRRENLCNQIQVARDGEEALDFLFCRGSFAGRQNGHPRLILLDLKLPKV